MKSKYIIEVTTIETRPMEWTDCNAWPDVGLYIIKNENAIYHVTEFTVDYIGQHQILTKNPIVDEHLSPPITELLFLKAIAAASRAETLK